MSKVDGPITDEGVRVQGEECDTCIFKKGNVMFLRGGRVRDMVDASIEANSAIVCHETLEGERSVCRGFFNRYGDRTIMCRLAHERMLET